MPHSSTFPETPFLVCQPLNLYRCWIFFSAGISMTFLRRSLSMEFALLSVGDQSRRFRSRHRHERDIDDIFHSRRLAFACISCALARHTPQQREMPRVIIHQKESFMAHQKTMKCRSERSVRYVKWQRILQTQIKQRRKWESSIMFG